MMTRLLTGAITVTLLGAACAVAQPVTLDWANRKTSFSGCPGEVRSNIQTTFVVEHINDVLYSYNTSIGAVFNPPNPGVIFAGLLDFKAFKAPAASACDAVSADLRTLVDKFNGDASLVPKKTSAGIPSVPLGDTLKAWADGDYLNALAAIEARAVDCAQSVKDAIARVRKQFEDFDTRVHLPHRISLPLTIQPNYKYVFSVTETYNSEKTDESTDTCAPASGLLSLSFGVLFSSIQDRSYAARKVPDETENRLVVDGRAAFRPAFLALMNFHIPTPNDDRIGFALSAGPVVTSSGKADTSNFGLFYGGTAHLSRLLFLSAGFHTGQFADFPSGFYENRTVPANFGELTPVKRWTTRFAFALTFRVPDFSSLASKQK